MKVFLQLQLVDQKLLLALTPLATQASQMVLEQQLLELARVQLVLEQFLLVMQCRVLVLKQLL
ncbi:hypothetical protein [Synechococcus sp. UW140]|uniref:hypothetical protein n=1 Tax=Synechococcus sp. UW140 TaxID=368503 RepID=UPI003137FAE0